MLHKFVAAPFWSYYGHQTSLDCLVGKSIETIPSNVSEPIFFGTGKRHRHAFELTNTHHAVYLSEFRKLCMSLSDEEEVLLVDILNKLPDAGETILLFPMEVLCRVNQ
jgi:hypothetical protein